MLDNQSPQNSENFNSQNLNTNPNNTQNPTQVQEQSVKTAKTSPSWIYLASGLIVVVLIGLIGFSIWQSNQPTNSEVTVNNGEIIDSVPEQTALDWINSQDNTQTLKELVLVANNPDLFTSDEVRTIFVPTDEAFDKFPQGQLDTYLNGEENEELLQNIRYHIVEGSFSGQDLVENRTLESIDGLELKLSGNSQGQIIINDYAIVTTENIRVKNAIIHLVDSVLLPTEAQVNSESEVISVYTGLYNGTATISNPSLVFQTASFNLSPNGNMILSASDLSLQFLNETSVLVNNQYPSMNILGEGTASLNADGTLTLTFTNVGVTFEANGTPLNNEQSNRAVTALSNRGIVIPSGQGLVTTVQPTLIEGGLRIQNIADQPLLLNMELQKV